MELEAVIEILEEEYAEWRIQCDDIDEYNEMSRANATYYVGGGVFETHDYRIIYIYPPQPVGTHRFNYPVVYAENALTADNSFTLDDIPF